MPWPAERPHPTVSIVMTLFRHRGRLAEAIAGWAGQTYPADKLEFVFIGNGAEPRIEEEARSLLANGVAFRSKLLHLASDNEMELYDFAARQASGQWLLFTEPHCVAQPDCVAELIGALLAQGLTGGCVRTLSEDSPNWVARVESRMYLDDAATWTREGDWRKFTKRGFALLASAYREAGGLAHRYGWFSEAVLPARLDARGHRFGYVPTAAVKHYNSHEIGELLEYVWEFQRQKCQFSDECDDELRAYFPPTGSASAVPPAEVTAATLRAIRGTLLHGLRNCRTHHGTTLVAAMAREAIRWRLGPGALHAAGYWPARLRLAWPWQSEEQRYRTFLEVWNRLAQWAVAVHQRPKTQPTSAARCALQHGRLLVAPGYLEHGLYGFHDREVNRGRAFRWTSPAASLALDMAPADYTLTLDTGGVGCISLDSPAYVYFNGRPAGRFASQSQDAGVQLRSQLFNAGQPQVLTLISAPQKGGLAESRALGLPLFALRLQGGSAAGSGSTLSRAA